MYIPVLEDGSLVSIVQGAVEEKYEPIVNAIVADIVELCGDNLRSIILRGSVAYKNVLPGISDIDMVIILKQCGNEKQKELECLAAKEAGRFQQTFSTVDLSCYLFDECLKPENNRLFLNLKLTGMVLWGEDVLEKLPTVYCDNMNAERIVQQTIRESVEVLDWIRNKKEMVFMGIKRGCSFLCVWFMRNYCRGLIAFTMCKRHKFALDIRTCCEEFMQEFPEHAGLTERCRKLEMDPTNDWDELLMVAEEATKMYLHFALEQEERKEM